MGKKLRNIPSLPVYRCAVCVANGTGQSFFVAAGKRHIADGGSARPPQNFSMAALAACGLLTEDGRRLISLASRARLSLRGSLSGVIAMTKTTLGVIMLVLALFTLANARANSALAKPAKQTTKKLTCEAAAKKYGKLTSSDCSVRGAWPASTEASSAEIAIIDEDNNTLSDFCVRVDGTILKRVLPKNERPTPEDKLSVFPLERGTKVIEVQRDDVGKACQVVEIKPDEMSKVAFQFFRLREKVTPVNTAVFERQYYGSIVVLNAFDHQTEVFVDRKKEREEGDIDDRMSKGSGSLKISNLAPDKYLVEVRPKGGAAPLTCGAKPCVIDVELEKCTTVTVDASADRMKQQPAVPIPCVEPQKSKPSKKGKSVKARNGTRTTRADRHFWR
jgi:hypothetical protein